MPHATTSGPQLQHSVLRAYVPTTVQLYNCTLVLQTLLVLLTATAATLVLVFRLLLLSDTSCAAVATTITKPTPRLPPPLLRTRVGVEVVVIDAHHSRVPLS